MTKSASDGEEPCGFPGDTGDDCESSQQAMHKRKMHFSQSSHHRPHPFRADGVRGKTFRRHTDGPRKSFYSSRARYQDLRCDMPPNCHFGDRPPRDFSPRSQQSQLQQSQCNWYKVTIVGAQKLSKDFVIDQLQNFIAPVSFVPIMYRTSELDANFFVEDHQAALKIANSSRKIKINGDFQMQIKVKPGKPHFCINDEMKEKLKLVLEKRFSKETNSLSLSNFHSDVDLAVDFWCPLHTQTIFSAVMEMLDLQLQSLIALNLDSNSLKSVNNLSIFCDKLPNLKILHLGDNWIRHLRCLESIKSLDLEELKLAGNPLCRSYQNKFSDFCYDVKKIFPKLLVLDGRPVTPAIQFDVKDEKRELPATQKIFVVEPSAQEVAVQFLQQYFNIFDSENRSLLVDAYHKDACFSISTTVSQKSVSFRPHLTDNRNLIEISNLNQRRKLLKNGKEPVVAFLLKFPKTEHNLGSISLDLSLATDGMVLLTVTGFFNEFCTQENVEILRYFNRTFTIVPEGTGFCITNEQLHISNPTLNQTEKLKSAEQRTLLELSTGTSMAEGRKQLSEEVKHRMAVSLSAQTNMNIEWSSKCLEEMAWNFDNALAAFRVAFELGKIPSTAFER